MQCDPLHGPENASEGLADRVGTVAGIVLLTVASDQRQRHEDPPDGGDGEAGRHREAAGQHTQHIRAGDIRGQRDEEREAGADVAPGVSVGGDRVHPVAGGHIVQHRVIDGERRVVENACDQIDGDEDPP